MVAQNPRTGGGRTTSASIPSSTKQATIPSTTATGTHFVTSSSTPSSSHASISEATSPGNSSISSAALAGGIVGAALGTALLVFLLTSLFCLKKMRDQNRSSQRRSRSSRSDYASSLEKPVSAAVRSYSWEKYLPQPIEDQNISRTVKTLFDELQLHVENFYSRSTTPLSVETVNKLSVMKSHLDNVPITQLLAEAESSLPIIKHCLSYMVTSSIDFSAAADLSLLPSGWTMPVEHSETSEQRVTAKHQAMIKWRELTAYLHPNPDSHLSAVADRDRNISAIVEKFTTTFRPWQSDSTDATNQNLKAVLRNAAHVSFVLFSQPSSFKFNWQPRCGRDDTSSERDVVVVPELMKVADANGNRLAREQVLVDMVRERL